MNVEPVDSLTMVCTAFTFPIDSSMGKICLELYWDHAPKTCRNFSELARRGYYNGTIFHRIIADFMIQGGDPTGTGGCSVDPSAHCGGH